MSRLRLTAVLLVVALVASSCSFTDAEASRRITARFSRAVQLFPGNSVRVLGVQVGRVVEVENVEGAVEATFTIDREGVTLPADVKATIVPVSLLGERYIELFPAYSGGPKLTADEIPLARTSVPAEQDELLRSLQDYFGDLDPEKVRRFVTAAARVLERNGRDLNELIDHGTGVITTLNNKRDSLAGLIVQMNRLTQTLSTRRRSIARLLVLYNSVARMLNENRSSLEGTISGLNAAATELADLLVDHRDPLGQDIRALTYTARTMRRNVHTFVRTGHWAERLFMTASRAIDYERDWLRLGNQGGPLFELILDRLRDRLVGLCIRLGHDECASGGFWARENPELFCFEGRCSDPKRRRRARDDERKSPGERLEETIRKLPRDAQMDLTEQLNKAAERVRRKANRRVDELIARACRNADDPRECRRRTKRKLRRDPGRTLDDLIDDIEDEVGDAGGSGSGGGGPGLPGGGGPLP
ncbi:MAG: MCE family protein [Actinomycetota bacterium]